jgi:hypothetical protein
MSREDARLPPIEVVPISIGRGEVETKCYRCGVSNICKWERFPEGKSTFTFFCPICGAEHAFRLMAGRVIS